jgi:hypothetical protein
MTRGGNPKNPDHLDCAGAAALARRLRDALANACARFDNHPPKDVLGREIILARVRELEAKLKVANGE